MTARTHLSIGEVLSLLEDDFPDLTITKIRFLESQGLINPERTKSGYRKFYDFDIERLRWILRQQRENFLPLKVIRDRLNSSDGKPTEGASGQPAQPELDLARDPGEADPPPVWMADHAEATRRKADHSDAADPTPVDPAVPTTTPNETATSEAEMPPPKPPKSSSGKKTSAKTASGAQATGATPAKPAPAKPAASSAARSIDLSASDVSLTRSELLGAAGLTDSQLGQLESFGIVVADDGPDTPLYGADAVVSASHAATFLALGIEARHLRAFKVAADRESGLYEQLVLPLLRQRNPTARSEALQLVERLSAAGAAIHAALLSQSLRTQLHLGR